MIRRAAALVVPLLLVALTVGIGVWDLQTARSNEQQAAAAARPTPSPPPVPVIHPRQLPADFQAGVSVVVYGNDPYFQLKARALLDRLARLGVNSLSLVIPVFQQGWSASQVYVDPVRTPSDARIAVFATEAHRRGFTLMLRPLLDIVVAQDGSHWRGSIQPPDPARWKQTYAAILMNYARLAQANRVDSLDVGSELDSMEADGSFWVSLIGSVRTVFRGQLTYSSNWAKGYPSFGRTLDFISIDAYFPLNAAPTAATADLVNAWGPWIARLDRIRRSFGRPLVLTELGVTSQVASFQQPWLWDNGKPVDLVSQETYYQASCQATTPNVSGLYWWMYTIDPPAAPMLDKGFAVAGKPAEAALGRCFGGHL